MSAFVEAIASHLELSGLAGGSTDWPIHRLVSPTAPDKTITIYETGGPAPEQATDRRYRQPSFQIIVRAGPNDVRAACDKAVDLLLGLDRAALNGFTFFVASQSTPIALGPDQNERYRFSLNFRAAER